MWCGVHSHRIHRDLGKKSPSRERSHICEIKVAWEDDFPMDMLVSRRVVYLPTFIPQHWDFDGETTCQENTRVSFFFGGGGVG